MKRILPFFLFLIFSFVASAQLVISEISYNPPESGMDSLEYIELYNETSEMIDLAGYIIEDNNPDTILSGTIPAGEYRILAINPTAIMTVLGVEAIEIERIATNNGGERIAISDPNGNLIDEVTYDDEEDWPTFEDGTDGAGATIELCDVTSNNEDGNNWGVSTNDLGVMVDGTPFLGTPNAANSASCDFVPDHIVEVSNNVFTPKDLVINAGESVRWMNVQGFHNVNGSLDAYPDNPEGFINGQAASGAWTFDYTFTMVGVYDYQCDPHVGLGMVGTVTVMGEVEPTIPTYDIGVVNTTDENGVADSMGVNCIIEGVVHGANLREGGLQFALVDESGDAIGVFSNSDPLGYVYAEGDLMKITGFISQFNGLTQINATAVDFVSSGNALQMTTGIGELSEETESQLIQTVPVRFVDIMEWDNSGGSFNFDVETADGTVMNIRVDSDTEIAGTELPSIGSGEVYDLLLTGVGGQFDNSSPFDSGYQMFPRYISDFSTFLNVEELEGKISVFPNPVANILNIDSDVEIESFDLYSNFGQKVMSGQYANRIDVSALPSGQYMLVLNNGNKARTIPFMK